MKRAELESWVTSGNYRLVRQKLVREKKKNVSLDSILKLAVLQVHYEPDNAHRRAILDALLLAGAEPCEDTLEQSMFDKDLFESLLPAVRSPSVARKCLLSCMRSSRDDPCVLAHRFLAFFPHLFDDDDGSVLLAVEDVPLARLLIENQAMPHFKEEKSSALVQAIQRKNIELVKLYLDACSLALLGDITDEDRNLMMIMAMDAPSVAIAALLLASEVPVMYFTQDGVGVSALLECVQQGNLDLVLCLLQVSDHINRIFWEEKAEANVSALMVACLYQHSHLLQSLCDAKADVNQLSSSEMSALDYCCNDEVTTRALLTAYKVIPTVPRDMYSIMNTTRNYKVVRLLFEHARLHEKDMLMPQWIPFKIKFADSTFEWNVFRCIFASVLTAPWHPDRIPFLKEKFSFCVERSCLYLGFALWVEEPTFVDSRLLSFLVSQGVPLGPSVPLLSSEKTLLIEAFLAHLQPLLVRVVSKGPSLVIEDFLFEWDDAVFS